MSAHVPLTAWRWRIDPYEKWCHASFLRVLHPDEDVHILVRDDDDPTEDDDDPTIHGAYVYLSTDGLWYAEYRNAPGGDPAVIADCECVPLTDYGDHWRTSILVALRLRGLLP